MYEQAKTWPPSLDAHGLIDGLDLVTERATGWGLPSILDSAQARTQNKECMYVNMNHDEVKVIGLGTNRHDTRRNDTRPEPSGPS